jgi:hypothetical protein
MSRRTRPGIRALLVSVLATGPLGAVFVPVAAAAGQIELSGGTGLSTFPRETTYESRYEPPFGPVERTGVAMQVLTIDPDRAALVWASLGWFPARHLGFEGRVDFRRPRLSGLSGAYQVSLRYVTRQPPDYTPREFAYEREQEWPETSGHLGQLTATGAVVLRAGNPGGTTVRLLAGAGITSVSGRLEPIGFSSFALGGHGVLFPEERMASARIVLTTTAGVAAGAEFAVPLGGPVALVAGWRLFVPRRLDADIRVDGFAAADPGGLREVTFDTIQESLAPGSLGIRPVTSDFTAGLQIRF